MFTLEVENKYGKKLKLTQNESNYQIDNIEGLTPPTAELTTNTVANMHGERLKNSRLEMRELVLSIKINGEVEKNRIALYDFFNSGDYCKIYYKNGSRNVYCEGYCENFESELFEMNQTVQISVICPDPFWKSALTIYADISKVFGGFTFPFAIEEDGIEFASYELSRETLIYNQSESECGMIVRVISDTDNVSNFIFWNVKTNKFMKINATLNMGDELVINTKKGEKSVLLNGQNIIGKVEKDSTWLQLQSGANYFSYSSDNLSNHLTVMFEYNNLYKGV